MALKYTFLKEILYVLPKNGIAANMFRSDRKVSLITADSIITKPHTFPSDPFKADSYSDAVQIGYTMREQMFSVYRKDGWTVQDNGFEVICKKDGVTNYYYGFRIQKCN